MEHQSQFQPGISDSGDQCNVYLPAMEYAAEFTHSAGVCRIAVADVRGIWTGTVSDYRTGAVFRFKHAGGAVRIGIVAAGLGADENTLVADLLFVVHD